MVCKICQSEITEKTIYCPYCGYQIYTEEYDFKDEIKEKNICNSKKINRNNISLIYMVMAFLFYLYSAYMFFSGSIYNMNSQSIKNLYKIYIFLHPFCMVIGCCFIILAILVFVLGIKLLTNKKIKQSIYRMALVINIGLIAAYISGSYIIIKTIIHTVNAIMQIICFFILIGMLIYITRNGNAA